MLPQHCTYIGANVEIRPNKNVVTALCLMPEHNTNPTLGNIVLSLFLTKLTFGQTLELNMQSRSICITNKH